MWQCLYTIKRWVTLSTYVQTAFTNGRTQSCSATSGTLLTLPLANEASLYGRRTRSRLTAALYSPELVGLVQASARGLSTLSDQGMVAMLGDSRPNPFCECAH